MNNYNEALEFFIENGIKLDKSNLNKLKDKFNTIHDNMNDKYYDITDKYKEKHDKSVNLSKDKKDRKKLIDDIKSAIEDFLSEYKIKKVRIESSNTDLFISGKSNSISYNVIDKGSTNTGLAIIVFLATGFFYKKTTNKNSINMSNSLQDNKVNENFRKCLANVNKNYNIKLESLSSNSIVISAIKR